MSATLATMLVVRDATISEESSPQSCTLFQQGEEEDESHQFSHTPRCTSLAKHLATTARLVSILAWPRGQTNPNLVFVQFGCHYAAQASTATTQDETTQAKLQWSSLKSANRLDCALNNQSSFPTSSAFRNTDMSITRAPDDLLE